MIISPEYRPRLVIMLKEPRAGRVKTRLGRDIGMTAAAWWFRHQSRALISRLGADPRWQVVLAVSPDHAGLAARCWPVHLARFPQGRGNLGDRMTRIFRAMPKGPVVIIGADIPGIRRHHIARAFAALGRNAACIGPAADGGYWLIGLKRMAAIPAGLLDNVRWSGPHAMADTMLTLPGPVALLDRLRDVDTQADL